jgi:hypothetical protein
MDSWRFPQQWMRKFPPSLMWLRVVWQTFASVWEEHAVCLFRVEYRVLCFTENSTHFYLTKRCQIPDDENVQVKYLFTIWLIQLHTYTFGKTGNVRINGILRCVRVTFRCSVKATSILYSDCVFIALSIQHAMYMRHIVICGLPGSTVFFTLSH